MLAQNMASTYDKIVRNMLVAKVDGHVKFSLIDLEAYGESYGDRAEAA